MKLIIVRHGETNEILQGILQGQTDCTLSADGSKQAMNLAECLKNEKIDLIYCSDLGRCKDSLAPLLNFIRVNPVYTFLLREKGKGIFDGKSKKLYEQWKENNPEKIPQGGESREDVDKRAKKFLDENMKNWKYKTILIMAHGGPIASLLKTILGKEHDQASVIEKGGPNTSITIIELNENKEMVLRSLYSTKHLENIK